jgi:hypothetical protein
MNPEWKRVDLAALFTPAEITAICAASQPGRPHPFGHLLTCEPLSAVQAATVAGFRRIMREDPKWIRAQRKRLANVKDFSEPSAALAELRAYAALRAAFGDVTAVHTVRGKRTPDFCSVLRSGRRLFVEVQAKQWDQQQSTALQSFLSAPPATPTAPGVTFREHVTAPFGSAEYKERVGRWERVTEQIVSRVCAIKSSDSQLPSDQLSLLWLDFQDVIWDGLHLDQHIAPLLSWNGAITSGGLWNGFYGRKGLPLCENADIDLGLIGDVVSMQHDGRFYIRAPKTGVRLNRAAAVVLSFPEKTIIFQDPVATSSAFEEVIIRAFQFPWFRIEDCWVDFPRASLRRKVRTQHRAIVALVHQTQKGLADEQHGIWRKLRPLVAVTLFLVIGCFSKRIRLRRPDNS